MKVVGIKLKVITKDDKNIHCHLKQKSTKNTKIKHNKNKTTYWKNPIKYNLHNNKKLNTIIQKLKS